MAKKRKTSISIETHRVVWLLNQRRFRLRCSECGQETSMVSLEEATRFMTLSPLEIQRRTYGKRLHFTETADGVLVCLKSLEN